MLRTLAGREPLEVRRQKAGCSDISWHPGTHRLHSRGVATLFFHSVPILDIEVSSKGLFLGDFRFLIQRSFSKDTMLYHKETNCYKRAAQWSRV